MKTIIQTLILLIALPLFSFSQAVKEFEGVIKYKHTVIAKDSLYNVAYDYSGIGYQSEFYYKAGDYKFVNHNSYFKADLFRSKETRNYLLLNNSDTVFCVNSKKTDAEIVDYSIQMAADTILGNSCNLITIKLKPIGQESPVSYRRYYYSDKLPIDPAHFLGCKANAYELIYEKARSLALRIEFEWPNKILRWQAYEIIPQALNDSIFKKENNWVLNFIN